MPVSAFQPGTSGYVPVRVAGVEYFESALLPGQPAFRCDRLSASVRVVSCVGMWTEANASGGVPDRLFRCRSCPVGAEHAGEAESSYHRLRGVSICARCHRSDLRLIGGNICVSCKNREYEWVAGRNAKGKFPVLHPALSRRRVSHVVGGEVRSLVRELTASTDELVVELLRDSSKRVVIGLGVGVMGSKLLNGDGMQCSGGLTDAPEGAKNVSKKTREALPDAGWSLIPHVCRHCFGRLLSRSVPGSNEAEFVCSNCGASAIGAESDVLCSCGVTLKTRRDGVPAGAGLRCSPNPSPSPEFPSQIVAIAGDFAGSNDSKSVSKGA